MSDRQKREYLREDREPVVNHKEERAWNELEKKLDAKTIDCRKAKVTEAMRKWYRETFSFKADDESICMAWKTRDVQ